MSLFLTVEEAEELTGYRKWASQRDWLKRNAVPFYVAASGRPIVLKEALHERTKPQRPQLATLGGKRWSSKV